MKKTLASVLVVSSLFPVVACGGSSSAADDDCGKLVDAYAHAWQRCMRGTYDDAKKTFSDALMCGKASTSNSAQVDMCVTALNALDCAAVSNGTSPSECTDSIMQ